MSWLDRRFFHCPSLPLSKANNRRTGRHSAKNKKKNRSLEWAWRIDATCPLSDIFAHLKPISASILLQTTIMLLDRPPKRACVCVNIFFPLWLFCRKRTVRVPNDLRVERKNFRFLVFLRAKVEHH